MSRAVLAGAMILLSIASGWAADDAAQPSSTPPAPANMQEPAVGDHWTYQVSDEISGKIASARTFLITEVSKTDVTTRVDIAGSAQSGTIVYDRSWNILSENAFRYSPNDGTGVRVPLAVGAQWKFTTDSLNSNTGATFKRIGSNHVTGMESVTTKAGTFDTFVIETKFTGRNTKNPSLVTEVSIKTWFSPEVNHWVKRSSTVRNAGHLVRSDTTELTEFGRKK